MTEPQSAPTYDSAPGTAGGPVGKVRPTGVAMALYIVTLGFYAWYWFYAVHKEMKDHSGNGLGGGLALVLAIIPIVSVAMPFISSSEVGELYRRRGEPSPVSGTTGLWYFPGSFLLILPIVWFVKTNGALNRYWESLGAAQ